MTVLVERWDKDVAATRRVMKGNGLHHVTTLDNRFGLLRHAHGLSRSPRDYPEMLKKVFVRSGALTVVRFMSNGTLKYYYPLDQVRLVWPIIVGLATGIEGSHRPQLVFPRDWLQVALKMLDSMDIPKRVAVIDELGVAV